MKGGLFQNKSLLILGSNVGADDIVRYARQNSAHTIVADYYPPERSSAKKISDENVLVSTADLMQLGRILEEKQIDGVLAGISEFNLLQAIELSERYQLPFYCSAKQWQQVENKACFRTLCEENGVPCPKTYFVGEKLDDAVLETIQYPVVIKPVDSSSSEGVHICLNEDELRISEADATSHSTCGKFLVDELVRGKEFTAHYTISNGIPTLSCVDNRYPVAMHEGNVTTIPIARIYPSYFIDSYIDQVNAPMLKLCNSLGLKDGVIFVQGMYDQEDGFRIFEGGLRSAGEAPYRFLEKVNGVNYMHVLVEHALLGESVSFDSGKEDPYLKRKCCGVVSFASKGGTVGAIDGLEEAVENTPSVIDYESRYPVGSDTPTGDTLRQLMIRFVMVCEDRAQMARDIEYLNGHINVLDDKGENMVVKMNPEALFSEGGGVNNLAGSVLSLY